MNEVTKRILSREEVIYTDAESLQKDLNLLAEDGILWRIGNPIANTAYCLFAHASSQNKSTVVLLHTDVSKQDTFKAFSDKAILCYSVR